MNSIWTPGERWSRLVASTLVLTLATPVGLVSNPASAGPTKRTKQTSADDPELAEARDLYNQGKAAYETFDYDRAVDLWTRAYAKLPDSAAGVRNAMVYNIAGAQEKAYELDKDPQHLRQAVLLLERYVKTHKMYKKTPETEAEVERAQERIAGLQEQLAAVERGESSTPAAAATPAPDGGPAAGVGGQNIVWSTANTPPPAQVELERKRLAERNKARRLIAGGWTAVGLGSFFLLIGIAAAAGSTTASAQRERSTLFSGLAGIGLGVGGLVTGGVLLGKGYKMKKAVNRPPPTARLAPSLGRDRAGATLTLRF